VRIFVDIETLPTQIPAVVERLTAGVRPPANYKSADAIAKWWAENGEAGKAEAVGKTALDGTFGRIACIGWAVDDSAVHVTTAEGGSERDLLLAWAGELTDVVEATLPDPHQWDTRATWIGHNLQDFDIRFIWQRCRVNRVRLPFRLPLDRYPKGPYLFDTMKEWSGWGKYVKQTDLELAFGLDRTDPLARGGADVATADLADTIAHCREDVRLLREIYRRMAA
jgi:hypothetical protein